MRRICDRVLFYLVNMLASEIFSPPSSLERTDTEYRNGEGHGSGFYFIQINKSHSVSQNQIILLWNITAFPMILMVASSSPTYTSGAYLGFSGERTSFPSLG